MDLKHAVLSTLTSSQAVVDAYLEDLTDRDILVRAVPNTNHIAWQLGHLISSERNLMEAVRPGAVGALPDGFAEKHNKATAGSDDPLKFLTKAEYRALAARVRADVRSTLEALPMAEFDRKVEGGLPPFLKNVGDVLLFLGAHWHMHAGQWAIIRRTLGKPPLF